MSLSEMQRELRDARKSLEKLQSEMAPISLRVALTRKIGSLRAAIKRRKIAEEGEDVLKELEDTPLYEGEITPEEEMELLYPKKKSRPKGIASLKKGVKFDPKIKVNVFKKSRPKGIASLKKGVKFNPKVKVNIFPKTVKKRPKGIKKSKKNEKQLGKKPVKVDFDRKGVDYVNLAKKMMNKLKREYKTERVPYLVFVSQLWNAMGRDIPWRDAIRLYRDAYYENLGVATPAKKGKKL
jgi:hypothetical protein